MSDEGRRAVVAQAPKVDAQALSAVTQTMRRCIEFLIPERLKARPKRPSFRCP